MSKFEHHIIGGAIATFLYLVLYDLFYKDVLFWHLLLSILIIPLYSVFPDIDQPSSRTRKYFLILTFITIIILAVFEQYLVIMAIALAWALLLYISKHRGFTHSELFGVVFALPFVIYDWTFALACYVSFLTHMFLDRRSKKNKFPY